MNVQPTLGKWFPVALMVGLLAGSSVYLTTQVLSSSAPWLGTVWVLFISWGAWFSVGAKLHRLAKFCAGLAAGVVFGVATLGLMGIVSSIVGDTFGLSVTVFLAATCIVLLELTDLFELAFIYFLTYAGYFAYVFGGFDKQPDQTPIMGWSIEAIHFIILLGMGVLYAILTVWLKNKLFDVERVPLDQRNTVFDKEGA